LPETPFSVNYPRLISVESPADAREGDPLNRAALDLLNLVDLDDGPVDGASTSLDRHDLSAIPWDSWQVGQVAQDPCSLPELAAAEAGTDIAHVVDGLADIPWMVWALDHPCEAEHAEDWLRTNDPQFADSKSPHVKEAAVPTSDKSPPEQELQPSNTPWMLWAIDHPCEAERAEAWLDDIAAGQVLEPPSIDDRLAASAPNPPIDPNDKRSPLWQRAMSGTFTIALALALILVTFVGYGRLDNRWYHLVTVQGGSMEPTYSIGDVLVLTRPPETVEVGMVLTMQVDGSIVTHRVVEVSDDGSFVTQGDANDYPDDFAGLDVQVVGQVRGALPLIGKYFGGRGSTNAWFTDQAVASTAASAGTTLTPDVSIDAAGSGQVAADSFVAFTPSQDEQPADDSTDGPTSNDTGMKETVDDNTVTAVDGETANDETAIDETVIGEVVDEVMDEPVTDEANATQAGNDGPEAGGEPELGQQD
jgi:signal peptidase I